MAARTSCFTPAPKSSLPSRFAFLRRGAALPPASAPSSSSASSTTTSSSSSSSSRSNSCIMIMFFASMSIGRPRPSTRRILDRTRVCSRWKSSSFCCQFSYSSDSRNRLSSSRSRSISSSSASRSERRLRTFSISRRKCCWRASSGSSSLLLTLRSRRRSSRRSRRSSSRRAEPDLHLLDRGLLDLLLPPVRPESPSRRGCPRWCSRPARRAFRLLLLLALLLLLLLLLLPVVLAHGARCTGAQEAPVHDVRPRLVGSAQSCCTGLLEGMQGI